MVVAMPRLSITGLRVPTRAAGRSFGVARADLKDVGVFLNEIDLSRVHDFRDDGQARGLARVGQHFQRVPPTPGRRRARCAALKAPPAGFGRRLFQLFRRGHQILFVHRAGPGHDHHFLAADLGAAHADHGVGFLEHAADRLVGLEMGVTTTCSMD